MTLQARIHPLQVVQALEADHPVAVLQAVVVVVVVQDLVVLPAVQMLKPQQTLHQEVVQMQNLHLINSFLFFKNPIVFQRPGLLS